MSLGDVFRSFLGLRPPRQDHHRDEHWGSGGWDDRDDRDIPNEIEEIFDIFSESLHMHKYFERQFGDIMRVFDPSIFEGHHSFHDENSIENFQATPERSLRDEYLKPGYQTCAPNEKRKDSDLDGIIAPEDVEKFLTPQNKKPPPEKFRNDNPNFFSRVVITQTVTKPDGSVETRKTVRDNRTNEEETTVTVVQKDDPQNPDIYNRPSDDVNWSKFFKH